MPFRLTRMLVNAMEISAVEGTFRSTCVGVMSTRSHQDRLMAMLEAFIHDPLIKWRLLQPEATKALRLRARQPPLPSLLGILLRRNGEPKAQTVVIVCRPIPAPALAWQAWARAAGRLATWPRLRPSPWRQRLTSALSL